MESVLRDVLRRLCFEVKFCEHKVQRNRPESVFLRLLEAETCFSDATLCLKVSAVDGLPPSVSPGLIPSTTSLQNEGPSSPQYGTGWRGWKGQSIRGLRHNSQEAGGNTVAGACMSIWRSPQGGRQSFPLWRSFYDWRWRNSPAKRMFVASFQTSTGKLTHIQK